LRISAYGVAEVVHGGDDRATAEQDAADLHHRGVPVPTTAPSAFPGVAVRVINFVADVSYSSMMSFMPTITMYRSFDAAGGGDLRQIWP
jgi:hypothetical protein